MIAMISRIAANFCLAVVVGFGACVAVWVLVLTMTGFSMLYDAVFR